jgi:type IV secretory pathway VirB3-like protein
MGEMELTPVNDSLNKPTTKAGLDYRVLGGCLILSVFMLLLASKLVAIAFFVVLITASKAITKKDPKMFHLWALSILQASSYDPGKGIK